METCAEDTAIWHIYAMSVILGLAGGVGVCVYVCCVSVCHVSVCVSVCVCLCISVCSDLSVSAPSFYEEYADILHLCLPPIDASSAGNILAIKFLPTALSTTTHYHHTFISSAQDPAHINYVNSH